MTKLKKIFIFTILIVICFSFISKTDSITISKGPYYVKDGKERYLPNIEIKFKYTDSITLKTNTEIRTTDANGVLDDNTLPVSPGAKVYGFIKATITIPSVKNIRFSIAESSQQVLDDLNPESPPVSYPEAILSYNLTVDNSSENAELEFLCGSRCVGYLSVTPEAHKPLAGHICSREGKN